MEEKFCQECGEKLMGRADKKFCGDACRNAFNNRLSGETNNTIRKMVLALKKNRRILEQFYLADKRKLPKKTLLEKGYEMQRVTHFYQNKKNQLYRFCFDYGFVEYEDGWIYIVADKLQEDGSGIQ
jgi:hypothetical protein